MKFKFLEDVAIADIAYNAYGKTLAELFENAALALSDVTVNLKDVKSKIKKEIALKSDKIDTLLYDFLSEIIFIKDTDGLLFSKYHVKIDEKKISLKAICQGEQIDRQRHELRNDVKAVTMHLFEIKKNKGKYTATIVVDI